MTQEITPAKIKELRDKTGVALGKCKEALDAAKGDMEQAIANLRKMGMASAVKKEGRETKEGIIKIAESKTHVALVEVNAETDFVVKNEKFQDFAHKIAEEACLGCPTNAQDLLAQKYSKDPKITIDDFRALTVQSLGENIQIKRVELFAKKPQHTIGTYSHQGGKLVTLVEIDGSDKEQELAKEIAMHIAAESPEYLSPDEIPSRVLEHEKEIAKAQVKDKPANIMDKIVEGKLKAYYDQVCLLHQHYVKDPSISIKELVAKYAKNSGKALKVVQFLRWRVGG